MKKVFALMLVILTVCAPISFAMDAVCEAASSDNYISAASGKLVRGIANAAFGWVELFRQPAINQNPWEGVGKGFVQTIARTGSGILEVATFIVPKAHIPLADPACPLDMMASTKNNSKS